MMTRFGLFTWVRLLGNFLRIGIQQYCQILWLKPSHLNSGFADYQYETLRETQATSQRTSCCAQVASSQLVFVRESRIQTIPVFQLKYLCSWSHNTLGLTDVAKAAITLGKTGVPVTASINALSREEKCVYTYVVIIGTPPTKAQTAKPASIQGPTSSEAPTSLALEGDVAPVPGLGDTIHLPGGPTTVVGHW
ncbi:hypothetical protein BDV34DRAFT_214039 [Aspergillus parasiticus]|uniref:Uncharacterized protein n=1 Tax=Aspergillus parasiticus TaxID=5067 RepID=A0A5N6DGD9_ASPPA|nr:hypothetical protein BDV34DRAFT_214039 [Aspergillus parasiticus]